MEHDREYQRLAFRIFADFGVSIAAPAVLAALLGKWLDEKFQTTPWILVSCFAAAFILTAVSVVKKAKRYQKEYVAIERSRPKNPRHNA